jgi:hypothetical protein
MKMVRLASWLLIGIGLLQIIGHIIDSKTIKGMGIITVASPLPIVFTQVNGTETFAQDFYIVYKNSVGESESLLITPQLYEKLQLPYNYRNVIGAAISYGPILPNQLVASILYFCLIDPAVVLSRLGLKDHVFDPYIRVESRTRGRSNKVDLYAK